MSEKCRKCRRLGLKLFLKGEKCISPKCPLTKRPYPPGERPKKHKPTITEYRVLLEEKQKLKLWYNLRDYQLKNYVKKALEKRGKVKDVSEYLLSLLELRLDNTIFRLGFASSRAQARQLVSHGFFLVNSQKVNIPSFSLKVNDTISIKKEKLNKKIITEIKERLKKYTPPSHLFLDKENLSGKVISLPKVEEILPPVNLHAVFEFYTR